MGWGIIGEVPYKSAEAENPMANSVFCALQIPPVQLHLGEEHCLVFEAKLEEGCKYLFHGAED